MSTTEETRPGGKRIDRWLFSVRLFKTRFAAADAVGGGKVHLNGERVKPCLIQGTDGAFYGTTQARGALVKASRKWAFALAVKGSEAANGGLG